MEIANIILSVIGLIVAFKMANPAEKKYFWHLVINFVSFTFILIANICYITEYMKPAIEWNSLIYLIITIVLNIQQYVIYKVKDL